MELSRRDLLKVGLFGGAALVLPAERIARARLAEANRLDPRKLPKPFTVPFAAPPVLSPVAQTATTDYYQLTQRQTSVEILPGLHRRLGLRRHHAGADDRRHRGRPAVVRQICGLPKVHPTQRSNVWTSTHLHGSCSQPQYDGYASDITKPGQYKDYR